MLRKSVHNSKLFVITLVLFSCQVFAVTVESNLQTSLDDYTHNAFLDEFGKVRIYWKLSESDITFEIHAETFGYVGFGLSPNGGMANADIVIGWVKDGKVHFTDRFATSNSEPSIDVSQDYTIIGGTETDTHTILTFSRPFITCDPEDRDITEGTQRLIYSYHHEDPTSDTGLTYHGSTQRGSRSVHLRGVTPQVPEMPIGDDLLTYDLLNPNISVPHHKDTTYWCQFFKMPKLDSKHHMIKYEPIVQPGHEALVHHILVYQLPHGVPDGYDGFGHECFSPNMPGNLTKRAAVIISWAIGGEVFYFPEEAGFSLGELENGDPDIVVMETHYDNPDLKDAFVDSSGIRITYTPRLRQHDAGVMEFGNLIAKGHFIPPGAEKFVTTGHCRSDCLTKGLGESDITVFASLLHSHIAGIALKTHHYRNGVELPLFSWDDSYDFNYQETRFLKDPITIRPGDELALECTYNTMDRENVTFGGYTTRDEMCLNFMYYYPRQTLSDCLSVPMPEIIIASLIGEDPQNVKLNPLTRPPTIILPEEYAGQRYDEFLSSLPWTKQQVEIVQASYDIGMASYCGYSDGDVIRNRTLVQQPTQPLPAPGNVCTTASTTSTHASRHSEVITAIFVIFLCLM